MPNEHKLYPRNATSTGYFPKFGSEKGAELASQVTALVHEMNGLAIDWSVQSLESAGDIIRKEMHHRHPDLSDKALRALAWKFTFDWR